MFGQRIGLRPRHREPASATLATLGPFQDLSSAELEATAARAIRLHIAEGLIEQSMPAGHLVFLESGRLQVQTHTGFVLALHSDTPQARYPLPLPPAVVTLYASEPSTLLCLPGTTPTGPAVRPPAPPPFSHAETAALRQLASHFRTQQCDLPSLPDLALKIGKAIDDPENRNEDIARLIQLDPALSTRILSVVNSAAFGGITKINSIQQATARLGRNKVRSLVYSCLIKGLFKADSPLLRRRMETLWQRSVHVAALSFVLGRETPGIDPEQALLAGLIHDIGSIAIIGAISRFESLTRRKEVIDYATARLRVEIGVRSLRQWRLPNEFEDVIRNATNWHRLGTAIPETTDVVTLALLHAMIGLPDQAALPRIDTVPAFSKLARGQLTPQRSLAILDEAEADVQELRALLSTG